MQEALDELERITGSLIGFFHFVNPDQTSLTLQNWSTRTKRDFCKAEGKGLHYPIDKDGVWVECAHQRKPVIHNNYASLPHKKGLPAGHAPVVRELVVPVIRNGKVVSILGVGNKPSDYDEQDVGTVSLFAEMLWDILHRMRTEETLKASEEKYRTLVETTDTGFLILDGQGKVVDANPEYVRLTGHADLREILGRSVVEWTAEHEKQRNAEAVALCVRDRKIRNLIIEYVDSKGRFTPVEINATVHGEGDSLRIVSLCRDITERVQAAAALAQSEKTYAELFDNLDDAVFVDAVKPDGLPGNRLDVNATLCRWLGYSKEELLAMSPLQIVTRNDPAFMESVGRSLLATGRAFVGNAFVAKDGREIPVETNIRKVVLKGVDAILVVARDITERKRAELREKELREKLERAARMESLGILAGGVAHDLNNILGPLVVLPDMVAEYVAAHANPADPEYPDIMDALKVLKTSAARATGVVSDLVVMGRRGQFQRAPVDVNRVVAQMLESKPIRSLRARSPDLHLAIHPDREPAWCMGSESRLARVLLNLIGNAAEAIDGQGDVTVRTGRQRFAEPYSGYEPVPAGDYVTIEVADTGCGMDAKTMARMFEPFFSTKASVERSGSGLGLSVVHGLVKDHAGFVDVKSAPGKGTTFTIYLPVADAAAVQESGMWNATLPVGSERVLVADDEPGQQYLSRRTLAKLGYAVQVVGSGEEAVALFEAAGREGRPAPFDVAMVDMIMKGMDGLAACKAIRALYPGQGLMVVSGHAPDKLVDEAKALGIGWLSKPYTAADLAFAARRALDR
jgi:PAS domain S-box-containing protein